MIGAKEIAATLAQMDIDVTDFSAWLVANGIDENAFHAWACSEVAEVLGRGQDPRVLSCVAFVLGYTMANDAADALSRFHGRPGWREGTV